MLKVLRTEVRNILAAQGGKMYGFNINNLVAAGYNATDIQNAVNYFRLSKQQAKFRAQIGLK